MNINKWIDWFLNIFLSVAGLVAAWILNIFLSVAGLVAAWIVMQVFVVCSFKIPSDSMEPTLEPGDYVLVNKLLIGPRLFNLTDALDGKRVTIYRVPGLHSIQRNDVLVFHFPHPHTWEKIEMHLLKYYVKRCIGLPGDSVWIRNGYYRINQRTDTLGNPAAQKQISRMSPDMFAENVYRVFPFDSLLSWNIRQFGPLYLPKEGDEIRMNRTNYLLYKKVIEWEQQRELSYQDSVVYLNQEPISTYRFRKNYYFMGGDNGVNSQDSRYWGLLPEEYIVGKVWKIWKSIDPYTDEFRWDRFLKTVK